jgi:hypothetical protein
VCLVGCGRRETAKFRAADRCTRTPPAGPALGLGLAMVRCARDQEVLTMKYAALVAIVALLAVPRAARAQAAEPATVTVVLPSVSVVTPIDSEPPPVAIERPEPTPRPNRRSHAMLYTGTAILSASYALTMATGFLGILVCSGDLPCDQRPMMWLTVPVFGPFVALGYGNPSGGTVAMGLLDGFVQAGAAALMVAGLVRRDRERPQPVATRAGVRWALMPMASTNAAGVALTVHGF